ncbi:endonuclease III domain-containing protein [Neolewinella antarctica]|uniref:Endonuclease-3 n=1 Tax=Neolewinella antarctica TaxID=442734 RepID=A0ABX0XEN7_9BACT|nr:endonuclease III [Neolewinella antarctica]NJC27575.1 endonuclease-3 [Neolewinella antarctica]
MQPTTQQTAPANLDYLIETLQAEYGRQTRYSTKSAVDQIIATTLSQRTNYADEKAAYDKLLATYGDWEGVAAAPVAGIEECIQTSRWPEVKAPRIKELLNIIKEEYGEMKMDFLKEMPVDEAQKLLMKLPGVGFKTATFVLLFSLRRPALPVDTHVHRVSTRFGILPPKITQAKSHKALLDMLPQDADELLNFHKLLFKHGQRVCTYSYPKCSKCVVAERCDYYLAKKKD